MTAFNEYLNRKVIKDMRLARVDIERKVEKGIIDSINYYFATSFSSRKIKELQSFRYVDMVRYVHERISDINLTGAFTERTQFIVKNKINNEVICDFSIVESWEGSKITITSWKESSDLKTFDLISHMRGKHWNGQGFLDVTAAAVDLDKPSYEKSSNSRAGYHG